MSPPSDNGDASHPLRVLEVVGNGIVGGMESTVRDLTRFLPHSHFQITCLCPYESAFTSALRQTGSEVFITPLREDPLWQSLQFAVQLTRTRRIDVIHAHLPNAHVLAGLVGCVTHTPVLATVHEMNLSALGLSVSLLTGTALVVVCQAAYAEALALGVPQERLYLVPNGVDCERFTPARSGEYFRRAVGVPGDAPLIGFVGRLAPEKGPDQFVRVAELVHQQRPDAHFVLVGEGPLREKVAAMIEARHLSSYVHLAGLWENAWEVYPGLDLLVQTSRSEGMPLVVLEAMACGVPVAAMDVGGVAELIDVGTTGVLAPPESYEALAGTVCLLLSQPMQMLAMGQAGRRRVEAHFRVQTSIQRTGEILRTQAVTDARVHRHRTR
jgi:glycosyltransferase involved in cell wall biosynthesis